MGNINCVRYCDYDGSCAAGKEIDRLKAELAAAREEKEKTHIAWRHDLECLAKLRALCAAMAEKIMDARKPSNGMRGWHMISEVVESIAAAGRGEGTK